MPVYYDDNFGEWGGMDDPNMAKFYRQVQKKSVLKQCRQCGRTVKLQPDYNLCNSCANQIERNNCH